VNLEVQSQVDITALSVSINYDPKLVRLKEIQRGDLVTQFGEKASFLQSINQGGSAVIGFSSPTPTGGVKSGTLAVLVFEALAAGQTSVRITSLQGLGPQGRPIDLMPGEHLVNIRQ
jgi:Cohesin domain.